MQIAIDAGFDNPRSGCAGRMEENDILKETDLHRKK